MTELLEVFTGFLREMFFYGLAIDMLIFLGVVGFGWWAWATRKRGR